MDKRSNTLIGLLLIPGVFFILLILICGYYNRFASDDYLIIVASNEQSSMQFATAQFLMWQGTFFISVFECWAFHLMQHWRTLLLFHVISLGLLIHALYLLLNNLLGRLHWLEEETKSKDTTLYIFVLAVSLCSCFFFMSHDLGQQSWFLISGSTRYLWPLILLVYAVAVTLASTPNSKYRVALSGLLFFIFGFSTVNFVLITILIYSLVLAYMYFSERSTGKSLASFIWTERASIFPFIMLSCGAMGMIAAPGNYVRREEYEFASSFSDIGAVAFSSVLYFIKVFIRHNMIYSLFFILVFTIAGYNAKSLSLRARQVFLILPMVLIGVILLSDIVQAVIMALAMGKIGPHRTFSLLSLLLAFACGIFGFSSGNYLKRYSVGTFKWIYFAGIVGLSTLNLKLILEQYPIVSEYAEAYDNQLQNLKQLSGDGGKTVYVSPLPQSGILYQFEFVEKAGDPMYDITKAYEKVNNLSVNVFVKASVNENDQK